jgi:hypothetical protein
VRFSDEELKHQELFRRIERLIARGMPAGYEFLPQPDGVASVVLGKSTWAVLALTCLIELFTQTHYRQSIEPDTNLSELYKDVFLFHWREESQHAILDELEWTREDASLDAAQREQAVTDLIDLVAAVDGLLRMQAEADVNYFLALSDRTYSSTQLEKLHATVLAAYRWQYILSGVAETRFAQILGGLITPVQMARVEAAVAPLMPHTVN